MIVSRRLLQRGLLVLEFLPWPLPLCIYSCISSHLQLRQHFCIFLLLPYNHISWVDLCVYSSWVDLCVHTSCFQCTYRHIFRGTLISSSPRYISFQVFHCIHKNLSLFALHDNKISQTSSLTFIEDNHAESYINFPDGSGAISTKIRRVDANH